MADVDLMKNDRCACRSPPLDDPHLVFGLLIITCSMAWYADSLCSVTATAYDLTPLWRSIVGFPVAVSLVSTSWLPMISTRRQPRSGGGKWLMPSCAGSPLNTSFGTASIHIKVSAVCTIRTFSSLELFLSAISKNHREVLRFCCWYTLWIETQYLVSATRI